VERKIYFNLTPVSITSAGSAVYAYELCHRLMRLATPLQVIPYTCPFITIGKHGIPRLINALLREMLWLRILANLGDRENDYFFCPTHNVPTIFHKRKYAIVILDLAAWHNPSITTWGGRQFAKNLPKSIENADQIFAISDYTAKDVANEFGISREEIIVAPCGLSELYKSDAKIINRVNEIHLPERYFLHVGTFEPKKNLIFLIKVYERFRELTQGNLNPVKLVLTGGEYFKKAETFILEKIRHSPYNSDIVILGRVSSEELPSLYRGATAFIFPSTFEGFGMPVIEALSQGVPTLVNSNTSLTQFGEFGATVFKDFDINVWANQLKLLSQNPIRIDTAYINKVRNYFDWDRTAKIVAENILEIY